MQETQVLQIKFRQVKKNNNNNLKKRHQNFRVAIVYYLKCQVSNKNYEHEKNVKSESYSKTSVTHTQGKKQTMEMDLERAQKLDLSDKDFKAGIINMLKEVKEIMA